MKAIDRARKSNGFGFTHHTIIHNQILSTANVAGPKDLIVTLFYLLLLFFAETIRVCVCMTAQVNKVLIFVYVYLFHTECLQCSNIFNRFIQISRIGFGALVLEFDLPTTNVF